MTHCAGLEIDGSRGALLSANDDERSTQKSKIKATLSLPNDSSKPS
ncbi:hypothetical protein BH20VER3_BH20VER3_12020 [soil metagenome]